MRSQVSRPGLAQPETALPPRVGALGAKTPFATAPEPRKQGRLFVLDRYKPVVPSLPPDFDRFYEERAHFRRGLRVLAGVDEAGRGPLAGPVVAAAVILPFAWYQTGIPTDLAALNDSKQLRPDQRECFFGRLTTDTSIRCAIAVVAPEMIDAINILQATHRAMNQALSQLRPAPEHALVDGLKVKTLILPQTALVKGDGRSYSIAAASVLAKVTRDRLMLEADKTWPQYGFARHKGYPTPEHLAAVTAYGPCPIHRLSFAPLRPASPASPATSVQPELFK